MSPPKPTLDISLYTQGSASARQDFAAQLLDNLSQDGFVKIVGHGISEKAVAEWFEWSKTFFALPPSAKTAIAHPGGPDPQRGFSRVGAENSSTLYRKGLLKSAMTEDLRDAREHFDLGAPNDSEYPNRWPSASLIPPLRPGLESAFAALETVAAALLSALETAYRVPAGTLTTAITRAHNASELRLNHYPAIPAATLTAGAVSRIWPHFDLGVITLLFQDRVSGLEFEDRRAGGAERFVRVESERAGEMVVNVSETLQRWTNGRLRAGLHRVGVPRGLEGEEGAMVPERFSVAYFCKADREACVGSLGAFVAEGEERRYEAMTALEYHQLRLKSAY